MMLDLTKKLQDEKVVLERQLNGDRLEGDEARDYAMAVAAQRTRADEQRAAERAEREAPWKAEHERLAALRDRAQIEYVTASKRADASPLDVGLATDALGAERCFERIEARLNAHDNLKP